MQCPPPWHEVVEAAAREGQPIKRRPGRPRKVAPAPTVSQIEHARLISEHRDHCVESDALVAAVVQNAGTDEVLHQVIQALALESAELRFEIRRAQAAARADKLEVMMSRRIDALVKLAHVLLDRARCGVVDVDLRSVPLQRIHKFFMATVMEAARATLSSPEPFCSACETALSGWEERFEEGEAGKRA